MSNKTNGDGYLDSGDTLGIESAATYLNIGRSTLQSMVMRGDVPGAKIGKSWVFLRSELKDWLRLRIVDQTRMRQHATINPLPPRKR